MDRVGAGREFRHESVARLVIGGNFPLVLVQHHALALSAHEHLVLREFEIMHLDGLFIETRRDKRRFVHDVFEIRARKSRRAARNRMQIDIGRQRLLHAVHPEDRLTALEIGTRHDHATVKTAGPEQRRIQHIRPVGRRHDDHALVRFETIHLDEQLVQCLFTLVVAAAKSRAAMAPHGIDFIDEDDARRVALALLEQIAYAGGAHADKHLDKIRT